MIHPGDIALSTGDSLYDRIIKFGTHSTWNHVAVVTVVEETTVAILEMTSQGCSRTVLPRHAKGWGFRDSGKTQEERADGLRWAEKIYSHHPGYGWFDISMIALHVVFPWWPFTLADKHLFCSQLVAGYLAHAGDDTFSVENFVTPGDIAVAFPVEVF